MADGSAIVERLESLDAASQQLSYALLTDTPFTNCLTTMAVRGLGPYLTELAWSATCQSDALLVSEAVDLLAGGLAANCLAEAIATSSTICAPPTCPADRPRVASGADERDRAPCADSDDDNDGVADANDAFPLDAGKVIHVTTCTIYGVNDKGSNDSQFFTINPATRQVAALGALRKDYDIEALAVDPATGILYGTSGTQHRAGLPGRLFIVDGVDGSLSAVGRTGYPYLRGLAFHPTTGVLWGWGETGPVTINTTTGAATLVRRIRDYTVDGLAWSNNGDRLYLAEGHSLFTYDPATHAIKRIDTFKRKIEALEMGPDGYLLMGQHGSKLIVIYDPLGRRMVHGVEEDHHPSYFGSDRHSRIVGTINVAPYNDPEGIAWRVCGGGGVQAAGVESVVVSPDDGNSASVSEQIVDHSTLLRKVYLPVIAR